MESDSETLRVPEASRLLPPSQSRISVLMNGVGNGMMLGAIPFLGLQLNAALHQRPLSYKQEIASIAVAGVGGIIGMIWGAREATHLDAYRDSIRAEIESLRSRLEQQEKASHGWAQRIRHERADNDNQLPAQTAARG